MKHVLKCFSCGTTKKIDWPETPRLGYELAEICQKVRWISVMDSRHSRVVAFCSAECHQKQTIRSGELRKYPKKV